MNAHDFEIALMLEQIAICDVLGGRLDALRKRLSASDEAHQSHYDTQADHEGRLQDLEARVYAPTAFAPIYVINGDGSVRQTALDALGDAVLEHILNRIAATMLIGKPSR